MHAESGTLPWDFRLVERLAKNAVSYIEKPNGKVMPASIRSFEFFQQLTGKQIPAIARLESVGTRSWNSVLPRIDWAIKEQYKVGEGSDKAVQLFKNHLNDSYRNTTVIYTDGSMSNGKVGLGITSGSKQYAFQLSEECSVFSAEAMAILFALTTIAAKSKYYAVIFSDSASVLSAVESGKSSHPWIRKIEAELIRLNAVLCWIPGHVGITGNVLADDLAARGRSGQKITAEVPAQDVKRMISSEIRNKWEQTWYSNRQPFLRQIKDTTFSWTDRKNPMERRALTRLRIGHTVLTHSSIWTTGTSICSTCNVTLTVKHVIGECRKYDQERAANRIGHDVSSALHPTNEESLVNFLKSVSLLRLL